MTNSNLHTNSYNNSKLISIQHNTINIPNNSICNESINRISEINNV